MQCYVLEPVISHVHMDVARGTLLCMYLCAYDMHVCLQSDDEEPKLKYQRVGASVIGILKADRATSLIAHEKFLVSST